MNVNAVLSIPQGAATPTIPPKLASDLLSITKQPGGASGLEIAQTGIKNQTTWGITMRVVKHLIKTGQVVEREGRWYRVTEGRK